MKNNRFHIPALVIAADQNVLEQKINLSLQDGVWRNQQEINKTLIKKDRCFERLRFAYNAIRSANVPQRDATSAKSN